MKTSSGMPKVALIAGPTASGKSDIAIALAKMLPITIINADASQVYRDLRVLSARPSAADEAACPHLLFGYFDGAEACSAARWAQDAKLTLKLTIKEGRLPVLVGGSGLYIRTLLDGIAPVPDIDPGIRAEVRQLDVSAAFAALTLADPEAATRLSPNDSTRVARALEVVRATGRTLKAWQADRVGGIADEIALIPMIVLPPRDWLFARCDARFERMLKQGAVDEVKALLSRNLDPALPVMRAIGVRELTASPVNVAAAQLATRQYAKRQYTWFRNQSPAEWPRHELEINYVNVNNLATILREMALT